MKVNIAGVTLDDPVVLAPMAGVCNPPFRILAKELGAGMVCAEMVSDKALDSRKPKSQRMLTIFRTNGRCHCS